MSRLSVLKVVHMPVNIISINSNNYGNRLQAYALQHVMREHGFSDVVSINIPSETQEKHSFARRAVRACRRVARGGLSQLGPNARLPLFDSFTKDHIATEAAADASELATREGIFLIGSDQCWNPSWLVGSREDGAQCAAGISSQRKMSYAASFGLPFAALPDEWRERYAAWLSEFEPGAISVRESAGAEIVRQLCGRDAEVVFDPTMLLASSEWGRIEKRPDIVEAKSGGFCLKYVLGADANRDYIEFLASKHGLRTIDLADRRMPVGPAEFVWLIRNAGLVCTDSFHASIFSLLFHTPFIIFERQGKNDNLASRFDTLSEFFDIEDHRVSSVGTITGVTAVCDWGETDSVLQAERERCLNWLIVHSRACAGE